jgi:cytochrome P450
MFFSVPLNVAHSTTADTSVGGYNIPAKTLIIPSLYSVHMDTKYFSNPEKFDPDRFLDGQGNLLKNEALLPFSTGVVYLIFGLGHVPNYLFVLRQLTFKCQKTK